MTINAIGSTAAYGSIAAAKSKSLSSSDDDSEIKSLQEQKKVIQKQIDDIKTSKQSDEIKQEQLKPLQQQLTQIDAQIQQKQLEKAKESAESDSGVSSASNGSSDGNDSVQISNASVNSGLLKMMDSYDKFGKLVSLSSSLKYKGAVMQSDAEIIAGNGNNTVAAKLDAQCSAFSADANGILISASKEAAKANKAGKEANKEAAKTILDKGSLSDTKQNESDDSDDKTGSADETQNSRS